MEPCGVVHVLEPPAILGTTFSPEDSSGVISPGGLVSTLENKSRGRATTE